MNAQIGEIIRELKEMPENLRIEKINQIHIVFDIFNGNMGDLLKSLNYIEENKDDIFALEKRYIFNQIMKNIRRLIHNFVSASYSFLDNSDTLLYGYKGIEIYNEYEKKKKS